MLVAAVTSPMGVGAGPAWSRGDECSLGEPGYSDWVRHLNTPFRIHAANGRMITVTLAEVKMGRGKTLKPGQRPPPDAANERFSLIFSGSRSELLEQSTYPFVHRILGRIELFAVPIFTRNLAKIDYQVVINRPRTRAFNDTLHETQTQG